MRKLYDILFTAGLVIVAPFYFLKLRRRGNWREGLGQRFGRYSTKLKQALTNRHVLWLHAVSVGEVNLCVQLIQVLEPRVPNLKLVVSTTTTTGMAELSRKLPPHISRIYFPIDRKRYVQRAMAVIRPEAIVLVEAEVWPNVLWQARSRRIPVFLINARMSRKSYRRYRRFGFLFRDLFKSLSGVGAPTEEDAQRLKELGCRPECVAVVGNLKFEGSPTIQRHRLDVPALFRQLRVPEDRLVLVGGSTHPGEEVILAKHFQSLKKEFPQLFLVLVPRHFERGKQVGQELHQLGLKFVYRSELTSNRQFEPGSVECLLVNTTGELRAFYDHASVIFVGKSLKVKGGQNPIEPGACGKAMVFGPHMENFPAIAPAFVQREAAVQVKNEQEFEQALRTLLNDPERRRLMGQRAREVVKENQGAAERTVEMIVRQLEAEAIA